MYLHPFTMVSATPEMITSVCCYFALRFSFRKSARSPSGEFSIRIRFLSFFVRIVQTSLTFKNIVYINKK